MDREDDNNDHMDSEREDSEPSSGWTTPNGTRTGPLPYEWTSGNASSSNDTSIPPTAPGQQYNYENRPRRRRRKSHGSSGSSSQSSSSEDSDSDNVDPNRMNDDQNRMEELAISRFVSQMSLNSTANNQLPPIPGHARPWRRMLRDESISTRGRGQSLDPVRFRTDSEGKISRSRSPVRSRSLGGPSERLSGSHRKPFQRVPGWSTGAGMDDSYPHGRRLDHSRFGGNHSPRSTSSLSRFGPSYGPFPNTLNSPSTSTSEDPYEVEISMPRNRDMQTRGRPSSFAFGNPAPRSSAFSGGHLRSRDQATTSFAFGHDLPSPSQAPKSFAFGRDMPSHDQNAAQFDMRDEVPFFTPSRGDIIILKPPQRGRKHNHHNYNPSLVRTFNDRFGFSNGDLIVRIGTYARTRHEEEASYIPYRILELYRRHDGEWTFLGDAHSQEDLGLRRRRSGLDTPPFRGRSGETCHVEPNWGDFIIRQHNIKHGEQGQGSIEDMFLGLGLSRDVGMPVIDWWTPNLPEEVNRVYPHNTILLRPYLRYPNFFWARGQWLRTPDVIHWDIDSGKGQQGYITKVWPESIVHDRPLPRDSGPLEVVGPYRVGVAVLNPPGSEVEEATAAWPLTSTFFLNVRDKSLYDYLTDDDREALNSEPWGLIEIYIYLAGVQPGWVYWGSSRHICDTPVPSRPSQ